jgi:hypothetical protein
MKPISRICRRVALLTCVSNFRAGGPGHTSLILDDHVYTFEIRSGGSGWHQIPTATYLKDNASRPLVIQELSTRRVNASVVYAYIVKSEKRDDNYLWDGVCSQQAANALGAGMGLVINPTWLMNTPYAVYKFIKQSGSVADSYHVWPEHNGYHFHPKRLLHNLYWPECERRCDKPPVLSW